MRVVGLEDSEERAVVGRVTERASFSEATLGATALYGCEATLAPILPRIQNTE